MTASLSGSALADLHLHSTFSDGILTPEELAEQAAQGGIAVLALTDHDTLRGLPPMARALAARGIRFIPGVELSTRLEGRQVHILGLGIRQDDGELETRLAEVRDARRIRLEKSWRRCAPWASTSRWRRRPTVCAPSAGPMWRGPW